MIALADFAVTVSNARATAAWWKEKVGFATYTIGTSGHSILVAPPGDRFVLHLCEGFAPPEPGNTGIAFVTDEIDAMIARMTQAGVGFPEPLARNAWGGVAKFADPDGNVFWLMEAPTAFVKGVLRSRAPPAPRPRPRGRTARRGRPRPRRRAKRQR